MNQPNIEVADDLARKAAERIAEMERPDYTFPQRFSRGDWIAAIAVIAATLGWLIAGVWL